MKYEDEFRPASAVAGAKRAQIAADLDGFVVKYEGLVHRNKRSSAATAKLEKQVAELQGQVHLLKKERTKDRAKLEALAKRNKELSSSLAALRKSWRLRVGVAATAPLRWVGSAGIPLRSIARDMSRSAPTGNEPSEVAKFNGSEGAQIDTRKRDRRTVEKPANAVPSSITRQLAHREDWLVLLRSLDKHPTRADVLKAASFGYYTLGAISEPLSVLRRHHELLEPLTLKEKQLVRTLEGLEAVREKNFALSPRQENPVYRVEPGRLLYCAHSVAPYNSNGYSTRTNGLVEGMASAGLDVVVAGRPGYPWDVKTDVSPEESSSFETRINGISHFFSSGPSWTGDRLDHYLENSVDSYVQVAMRSRAETIQAASNHVTALPALLAARRLGLPFIYEVRGLWEVTKASVNSQWNESEAFELAKKLETFVATAADLVFAITEQVREELIHRGVSPEKIVVLSNAVNTAKFSPLPPHRGTLESLGIPQGAPVIGYAGSLVEYEGLETLLEATKSLAENGHEFHTVIVGDGASLPRLVEKAKELGVTNKVTFTGRVKPSEVSKYMSVFDILPCPRIPLLITEMVSPLKPLEAMSAGKAVVLSDLAPLRDIAGTDGLRARLFQAGNAAHLAAVLAELIQDPLQREEMGRRARLWTVRERNWQKIGSVARSALMDNRHKLQSNSATSSPARELSELTLGIIADQFTSAGLEPETNLLKLTPDNWAEQLSKSPIDALFVESAWEGNDGTWKGKVGYYGDDSFADLRELISHCRSNSIPTIFWNKEDPVHFNRFKTTATYFDHVFTSDEGSISAYLQHAGDSLISVSSLPFYAQPVLHNPLKGSRGYSHTVAYAGSYYGDRYKRRSAQLQRLLSAAVPAGLSIYDRQHMNPVSPYKFPSELAPYVRGGLTYKETVEAYKAHPVHINVNSVESSGTMFSRRVYEIAACGGAIISGPGRGIQQMFGGIVPITDDKGTAQLLIDYWMKEEEARKADAWLALRAVYRSHTAGHRLAYVLRTAGLRIKAPDLEAYAVVAERLTVQEIRALENQSVPPASVYVTEPLEEAGSSELDIRVSESPDDAIRASGVRLIGRVPRTGMDRTYFEDLLSSRKYSKWTDATYGAENDVRSRGPLATIDQIAAKVDDPGLHVLDHAGEGETLSLLRTVRPTAAYAKSLIAESSAFSRGRTVLIAGHDLKFAQGIIEELQSQGNNVLVDKWQGHSEHDEEVSRALLSQADTVFCEWTLGNAVWYSKNKLPGQRLVTRLHLQEISTRYLSKVNKLAIDKYIFVGQHIANIAIRDFGIEERKSCVIPNYVPTEMLAQQKESSARWNLGIVGTVPQRKRLDLALDALVLLRKEDKRYKLFVKGKKADEYPWMKDRPEEFAYYEEQDRRIATDPLLQDAVVFEQHGDDMGEWYRKIGTVLSVSDFESFHLTIADGAASGAVPASLAWDGADQIYPSDWLNASVRELVQSILSRTSNEEIWRKSGIAASEYARSSFDQRIVLPQIVRNIIGD